MPPIPELEAIRKEQIYEATLLTIAKSGCANLTMADICNESGLSKGGLAHYYKSKYELLRDVFQKFSDRILDRCRETMNSHDDPLDKLLSLELFFDTEDQAYKIGYPFLFDFMSIAVHDTEYRAIFTEWVDNLSLLFKKAIELGQEQGRFQGVDPASAARAISTIYQGVTTRWFLAPKLHSTQWALETIKRTTIALLTPYEEAP